MIHIEEGDLCLVTFPIGLCATSRFRMQAKFGKTMQKAMSHKMELHTKAGGACRLVVQPLKIPNIRRVLHLVIFSMCWAGLESCSSSKLQCRLTATLVTFSLSSEWPP